MAARSDRIFRVEKVHVDDIDIAFQSVGSGKPLFLIMGLWGTMDLWPPRMIERLAERHRVIIYDSRGMGHTSSTEKAYSIELFADDLAGLIAALGYERASVLGWSMGSCEAQELALRHPDRVESWCYIPGAAITRTRCPNRRRSKRYCPIPA